MLEFVTASGKDTVIRLHERMSRRLRKLANSVANSPMIRNADALLVPERRR